MEKLLEIAAPLAGKEDALENPEQRVLTEDEEDERDIAAADARLANSDPSKRKTLDDLRRHMGR